MKLKQVKIAALSFSNTYPFVYGLQKIDNPAMQLLDFEAPAQTAERFARGEADIALVPVGALPMLPAHKIVSDFCIGAKGSVKSVCLYSHIPIEKLKKIYLDVESKTSVRLVQVLAKYHWKKALVFESLTDDNQLDDSSDGVVLIGDKTFGLENKYAYVYDLSAEWESFCDLPFVFAVWVAKPEIEQYYIQQLNTSLSLGIKNIDKLHQEFNVPLEQNEFNNYLRYNIDYHLDNKKTEAMKLFLSYVNELGI